MRALACLALLAAPPAFAAPAQTSACKVAEAYLGHVNRQDVAALKALFPAGTTYVGPDGTTLSDPDRIAEKYAGGFRNMGTPWKFRIENLLPFGSDGCLLEFSKYVPETDSWRLAAVDRIRVNAKGQVTYFIPYVSSLQIRETMANIAKKPG